MADLGAFDFVTLDGYFKGENDDISWHNFGEDEQKMSDELSNAGSTLIFGRVTYEMMAGYWTSADAQKNDPVTTRGMNEAKKLVFSRTLSSVSWQNTQLIKGDLIEEIRKLKKSSSAPLTILGSGQIVQQLTEAGLIDRYTFMINPLLLGKGTSLFEGLSKTIKLRLVSCRTMKSGNVLVEYAP